MAIATASVTFTGGGATSQAFTWSPQLTSNPPKVLACSVTVTDGGPPPVPAVIGTPTNIGGTVGVSDTFGGTVVLVGSD